jgi:hypothetical protein
MICELTKKPCDCPKCEHRIPEEEEREMTGKEVLESTLFLMLGIGFLIAIVFWMC